MAVESSEPMIFRPDTANSPEALALRELRKRKPGRHERTLEAAAGFFGGNPAGPVGMVLFCFLGATLAISGAFLTIGPEGLSLELQNWSLITGGALFLIPFIVLGLHSLMLRPGTEVYTKFRATVRPKVTRGLTDWLSSNGLELSKKSIAGAHSRNADDLAFHMGLAETIPDGEIPLIGKDGERFRGSFELLPDGSYALLLGGVDELYERTDHA